MFWKRGKNVKVGRESSGVGAKAAWWFLSLQRKGADRANGVLARMPARQVKLALAIFSLLSGGLSGYLVIGGVAGNETVKPVLTIEQSSIPKHVDKAGDAPGGTSIDGDTYAQLQALTSSMDSLALHHPNAFDSFLLARPGLVDTVQALQEIYLTK